MAGPSGQIEPYDLAGRVLLRPPVVGQLVEDQQTPAVDVGLGRRQEHGHPAAPVDHSNPEAIVRFADHDVEGGPAVQDGVRRQLAGEELGGVDRGRREPPERRADNCRARPTLSIAIGNRIVANT